MMKSSDQEATAINITDTAKTESASNPAATSSPHPLLSTPKSTTTTTNKQAKKKRGGWKQRCGSFFDFILRLAAIAAALAATITMGTADQTLPFFSQLFQFHANYEDLPALMFFVVANAIASGYLVLSLPFSVLTIIRPSLRGAKLLLLVLDTVMVALTTGAAASAAAIVYLAHNGNSKANWVEICEQFDEFCQQISGAVVASFVTAVIFMLLVILSALRMAIQKH